MKNSLLMVVVVMLMGRFWGVIRVCVVIFI